MYKDNQKISVENKDEVTLVASKAIKKTHKDIFLLAFIVFIVATVLIGLTVVKKDATNIGENVNLKQVSADKMVDMCVTGTLYSEDSNVSDVTAENEEITNGNAEVEKRIDELYGDVVNQTTDENGDIVLHYANGSKTTVDGNSHKFFIINFDDMFGTAPASTDDLVNRSVEQAKNSAYAANDGNKNIGTDTNWKTYDQYYTVGSNGYASGDGGEVGSNGTSSAYCYYYFGFSQYGTWGCLLKKINLTWRGTFSYSGDGAGVRSSSTDSTTSKTSVGSGSTGTLTSSNKFLVFYSWNVDKAGGGKNDTAHAKCSLSSCKMEIKHTTSDIPSVSFDKFGDNDWTTSRYINAHVECSKIIPAKIVINSYYYGSGSVWTSDYETQAPTSSGKLSKRTTYKVIGGTIKATGYSYTNKSYTTTNSNLQMRIDNGNPVVDEFYIAETNGNKITTWKKNSSLIFRVKAHDTGGNYGYGASSGVNKVEFYKNDTLITTAVFKQSSSTNNNGYTSWKSSETFDGDKANGTWKAIVYDNSGKKVTSSISYNFQWFDNVAPDLEGKASFYAESNDAQLNPNSSVSESNPVWTNDSLKMTFVLRDYGTDGTYWQTGVEHFKDVYVKYVVNGKTYTISYSSLSKSGNNYRKTFTATGIKFDYNTMTSVLIYMEDKTGNAKTVYLKGATDNKAPNVYGRIDTIAPFIREIKRTSESNNETWSLKNTTMQISVIDYAYSTTGNTGYYQKNGCKYNNGSGISKLYFYADSGCTKPLNITGTNSNIYDFKANGTNVGTTSEQKGIVDLNFDTNNTAFGGYVYVIAEDFVGNKSNGDGHPSNNGFIYTSNSLPSGGVYGSDKLYLYPGVKSSEYIKRDTFAPQIVVKSGSNIIASTMGLKGIDGKTTSLKYTFPWQNVSSQNITIDAYCGSSGGTLSVNSKEVTANSSSGYSDCNFNGSNTGGSGEAISKSVTGATSYSSWCKYSYTVKFEDKGENDYKITFTNEAKKSSATITITNRIDKDSPTISLLGFLKNGSTKVSSSSMLSSLVSQDNLLNSSSWVYPSDDNGYRAVFKIIDKNSGILTNIIDNPTEGVNYSSINYSDSYRSDGVISYGINGTSHQQKTTECDKMFSTIDGGTSKINNACYRFEFKYTDGNKNKYSYIETGNCEYVSGVGTLIQVQMFHRSKLKTLTATNDSSVKLFNSTTGNYNVTEGTYLQYKLSVSDFIGNISNANLSDSRKPNNDKTSIAEWNNSVLRYYVDPFTIGINSVQFYQMKNDDWSDDYINNTNIANVANVYKMTENKNTGWAKNYVVAEMYLGTGLSGFSVDYRYMDLTNAYSNNVIDSQYENYAYSDLAVDNKGFVGGSVLYNNLQKKAWVVFSNTNTKNVWIGLGVYAKAYSDDNSGQRSKRIVGYSGLGRFIVKQDVDLPIIENIFLSTKSTYSEAQENKLLTFNAIAEGSPKTPNYTFELDTANSPAYVEGKKYIYTSEKTYVYIRVSDKSGALEGSGVESVIFNGTNCGQYVGKDGTSYYYVTKTAYGYPITGTNSQKTPQYSIIVKDKQLNQCSATYGHSDKNGYRVLPVVDSWNPYIYLNTVSESGYLTTLTELDKNENGASGSAIKQFAGYSIKNNTFDATIVYKTGISGIKFYVRRRDYNDTSRPTDFFFYTPSTDLTEKDASNNNIKFNPNTYDFAGNGWGYYSEGKWMTNTSTDYPYIKGYENDSTAEGQKTGEMTIKFHLTSAKERIEILAVTGTGKYYIIDCGPLFIDTEPPVIHNGMTMFTVESESDSGTSVNYNNLQKIWGNDVTSQYTNGNVYIYYFITDPASGINDSAVRCDSTKLEKITVQNVPVYKINGLMTNVRVIDGNTPIIGNDNGVFTINGFIAYTIDSKAEKIAYVSNYTWATDTADLTYYRIKVEGEKEVAIRASDNAKNEVVATKKYWTSIDKSSVGIEIKARDNDSDADYEGYTGDKFTNKEVQMRWYSSYGQSGFGGFSYSVTDNFDNTIKNYFMNIPLFKKNTSGNIVMIYKERGTNTVKEKVLGGWGANVRVKAQLSSGRYYWMVNGAFTNVEINAYYCDGDANIGELCEIEWEIYIGYLYCYIDSDNSANRNDTYNVTAYNTVEESYAVGRVRPSASATFTVKIDIDKPIIDMNSGNIKELNDQIRWHALKKSLRINVYDELSGIGKTTKALSSTDLIEDITVSVTGETNFGYLIKDADGLYRAYNVGKSGSYFAKNGLYYFDKHEVYTIKAVDEAGNIATETIIPKIDNKSATITSIELCKSNNENYIESAVNVGWVKDLATKKYNWADDCIYAKIEIEYGESGYILQYRESVKNDFDTKGGKWYSLDSDSYDLDEDKSGNGKDYITYCIGENEDYLYAYYQFRVISKAQDTELNYYKSYTNSSKFRGSEDSNNNIKIELEEYEANDIAYKDSNGNALIALGELKAPKRIAIDKVAPDAGISLNKKDGENADGTDYYIAYGAKISDTEWKIGDELWSKDNVQMTLAFNSASMYASGNVVYYRSSEDGQNWSAWTLVYQGRLYQKNNNGVWKELGNADDMNITSRTRYHDSDEQVILSTYISYLDYTIRDSRNNILYEFYTESGAGVSSPIYKFGTTEERTEYICNKCEKYADSSQENESCAYYECDGKIIKQRVLHKYGIKIDKYVISISAEATTTYETYPEIIGNTEEEKYALKKREQKELKTEFDANFADNPYLISSENAVYTNKNTVIVMLKIQNVGYSGVKVKMTEGNITTILDEISYKDYMREKAEGVDEVRRYYKVSVNGETRQYIYMESCAGKLSGTGEIANPTVVVRIDNTTPIIYVKEIQGIKATNWGWMDYNLYNTNPEFWYISNVVIKLGIGYIEPEFTYQYGLDADGLKAVTSRSSVGRYYDGESYSGTYLEYNINNGKEWRETISELTISGTDIKKGYTYKFRATTKIGNYLQKKVDETTSYLTYPDGITYELGSVIRDNEKTELNDYKGNLIYTGVGTNYYDNNVINTTIKGSTGITPITGHAVKGIEYESDGQTIKIPAKGDFDDTTNAYGLQYLYEFSIDSKIYYYSYYGKVDLGKEEAGNRLYDTNVGNFTDYYIEKADANNSFTRTTDGMFHRGDVIKLHYISKYNGTETGALHNYFQNYTISETNKQQQKLDEYNKPIYDGNGNPIMETVIDRRIMHNYVGDLYGQMQESDSRKLLEKSGDVFVQFESSDIKITSYFIAEVDVAYGKDVFYLQSDNEPYKTTGASVYKYSDGASIKDISVNLSYNYYDYFTQNEANPQELGAYYLISRVTENTGSFRVTKSTARKDFVLKYFTMDNEVDDLFEINEKEDFGFIDESYYNLNDDGTVNETEKSYLSSSYNLNCSLKLSESDCIKGTYTGELNGNNNNIMLSLGTITDSFGIFDAISGTVKNLNITSTKEIVISATAPTEVGLLTKKLMTSGKIDNISVVADVELHSFNDGIFGGIVAKSSGLIGEINTGLIFTDIRITNNGREISNANISPVVGYMNNNNAFNGVFAFGEIELYNVTNVNAGMLYGGAEMGTYLATAVNYFDKNVFMNGDNIIGASTQTTGVHISGECSGTEYATFVEVGESPIIGGIVIEKEILTRLYSDFGYVYDKNEECGLGTLNLPLVISTVEHISAINGYMNLTFAFDSTVEEIDMASYKSELAITKVFNGTLTTMPEATGTHYVRLKDFAGNTTETEKEMFGLFGQLNGTIRNIVFNDINLDFDYEGEKDFYAGIVSAKAYENAVIENVIFIGTETIRANNAKAYIGGIVGLSRGAYINDIFNINNLSITANEVIMGGIAGISNDITLPNDTGSMFLLGRAEGYGSRLTVGSAIGVVNEGSLVNGGAKVFTILDNVYIGGGAMSAKPIGSSTETYGIITESFSYDAMRTAGFASAEGSAFSLVFNNFYPLSGDGSNLNPFVVKSEADFKNINIALYAEYRIENDIMFTDFETIGEGLVFSGVLKGSTGDDISAEEGKIVSLGNVTAPLVYKNSGKINDIGINVEYTAIVGKGDTFKYGAVAVISDGEIKNVTVAGNVEIISATQDTELYISGFVAECQGGVIDTDLSKLQNSISALNITVNGGGIAYIGGYAGLVTRGNPKFSYGIATGTITITGVRTTYTGLLVGMSHGNCDWILGEAASIDYTYSVIVDGYEVPKYDAETGEPLVENFYGLQFGD